MRRRLSSARLSAALVGGAMLLGATPQAAVAIPGGQVSHGDISIGERADALWYAERLKFDELQSQGATGEGIKIAVIDEAINPEVAELQGANITVKGSYCAYPDTGRTVPAVSDDVERAGHGTDVVAMLVGNGLAADGGPGTRGIVPDAEVWFYAAGASDDEATPEKSGCEPYDPATETFFDYTASDAFDDYAGGGGAAPWAAWNAVRDGADIVVYAAISGDIGGWSSAQVAAMRAGVPLVAGTQNPDGDLTSFLHRHYPYKLNGVVSVSGVDVDGRVLNGGGDEGDMRGDAFGSPNLAVTSAASALLSTSGRDGWGPAIGHGTSLATPLVAGTIALGLEEYPDATANQVLQAMIRTTGNSGLHEPEWHGDKSGYGIANPTALLTVDPTIYPDENPLFVLTVDDPRCTYSDGSVPTELDRCAWASGPLANEVWPAGGEEAEGPTAPAPRPDETPGWLWILVAVGGVTLAGVIAAAVAVPIVVSRSRKRRMQIPQPGANFSEDYRG